MVPLQSRRRGTTRGLGGVQASADYPEPVAELALLTPGGDRGSVGAALTRVLPALELLPDRVSVHELDASVLIRIAPDAVLIDGTTHLSQARSVARTLAAMSVTCPILVVITDGGLGVLDQEWGVTDFVLPGAGPAELQARLRLASTASGTTAAGSDPDIRGPIRVADVVVDEGSWTVRAGGKPLNLTYKEFELLKFLVQHPGRVVTREILLQEVWGMDYYGGTRTVDVHVRRLRAKLGSERESLIGTIRNVGYRFAGPRTRAEDPTTTPGPGPDNGVAAPTPEPSKPGVSNAAVGGHDGIPR